MIDCVGTIMGWQDSLGEPVLSLYLWFPQGKLWSPCLPTKQPPLTQPSSYPTCFFQASSYYGPGQQRTHHVAHASLKLSAILQPLPPESWGISHTSSPLPASDTYFWNLFLGTGGMWLLVDPQPLHQHRIQPHLPTSFSKNYIPI